MYRHLPHALIRTAALSVADQLPVYPGPGAEAAHTLEWLQTVWAHETLRTAVQDASPVLATAVVSLLNAGTDQDQHSMRRTALSVARYHLRATTRPGPFGLLAGIGPARFTDTQATQVTHTTPRVQTRPDALWLDAKLAELESDPAVIEHCQVVADETVRRHGDVFVLPHRPGSQGPAEARLRATGALTTILNLTLHPTSVAVLLDTAGQHYPQVPREVVRNTVIGLVRERFLHTDVRPPATAPDPLAHLAAHPVQAVRDIATSWVDTNRTGNPRPDVTWTEGTKTRAGTNVMNALVSGTSAAVSAKVARELERALTVMARTSPHPYGTPAWRAYRTRFLEAYSLGTLVPVTDLIDPVTGIGLPAGYRGASEQESSRDVTGRDEHLLALVQQVSATGAREIDLTAADVDTLAADMETPTQVPSNLGMNVSVYAASPAAIDEGQFLVVCGGLSVASGITAGRFLPLLDSADHTERVAALATLPTLDQDAVRVQISAAALRVRTQNVARSDHIVPDLIAVGEHNQNATIRLADLAVGATTSRMILVHLPTGRRIEPFVLNALEPTSATHPVVRFLYELPRAHTTVMAPFYWGAAGSLPFLPGVRTGRVILSEAQWKLSLRDIDQDHFEPHRTKGRGQVDPSDALDVWLDRWGVPDHVFMGSYDRRLRLDLTERGHRQLLAHEVIKQGRVTLTEAPDLVDYGWAGHAHQLTIEFAATQVPAPAPEPLAGPVLVRSQVARQPGTARSCLLKIYAPTDLMDTLLSDMLDAELARDTRIRDWWFIRYRDSDDHLKLRLRLHEPDYFGAVARHMADWAERAHQDGMVARICWDTDTPEVGRYGTGAVLEAAEEFFVTDSRAALAQTTACVGDGPDHGLADGLEEGAGREALTVASMVDLAQGLLGQAQGLDWILRRPRRDTAQRPGRAMQRLASRMAGPAGPGLLGQSENGRHVLAAWQVRREALGRYAVRLRSAGIDPAEVLGALLHMHHNRALGIDREREAMILRATRQSGLTIAATSPSTTSAAMPGTDPGGDGVPPSVSPPTVHPAGMVHA